MKPTHTPTLGQSTLPVRVHRWRELCDAPAGDLLRQVQQIFFDSSTTLSFASDAEKTAFEERWLGRYLRDDASWFYVAVDGDGRVAGYLAGSAEDPAITSRFADIEYFAPLADLTKQFPAHLHINLAAQYRSRGIGPQLIAAFIDDLVAARVCGVHVVTGYGVRNTRFYAANGFTEKRAFPWRSSQLVFLGRQLCG